MIFHVRFYEVHTSTREVEASSWEEAVRKAREWEVENEEMAFSYVLDEPIEVHCDVQGNSTLDYGKEPLAERQRQRQP